jgi:hypothetical protein
MATPAPAPAPTSAGTPTATPSTSSSKWWLILGIIAGFALIAYFMTGVNLFTPLTNFPSWAILFGGLAVAGVAIWVGEVQIANRHLAGISAKVARFATFALAALIISFTIYGAWSLGPLNAAGGAGPTWFDDILAKVGWFGVISIGVIALTLVFGAYRYTKIPGNASAYLLMALVAFIVFFGGIYLVGMLAAPSQTKMLLDAAQTSIEQGVDGMTTVTSPYGHRTLNWKALLDQETWKSIAIVLILGMAPVVVVHQYTKGNKVAVYPTLIVCLLIMFGSVYYLLKSYEPAREVYNDVTGAVQELNPAAGDDVVVNWNGGSYDRVMIAEVGPWDILKVQRPQNNMRSCINMTRAWKEAHQAKPWFDSSAFLIRIGSTGRLTNYQLTDAFKEALKETDEKISLEIDLLEPGEPCEDS